MLLAIISLQSVLLVKNPQLSACKRVFFYFLFFACFFTPNEFACVLQLKTFFTSRRLRIGPVFWTLFKNIKKNCTRFSTVWIIIWRLFFNTVDVIMTQQFFLRNEKCKINYFNHHSYQIQKFTSSIIRFNHYFK